ncbi:MAG: cytochrome c-type biogenesis protein CcmH [Anaerolineaceae bacterium]|nr:cytochrome c-type biogenesis protein CcmH [Anaerolineaceae bacterium]
MRHRWIILRGVLLALFLLVALPAAAQQLTVTDDDVNAIAKKMYCPVCENIPLDVCGTAACEQWRGEIRTQLEEGYTEAEIITDFINRFGERVVGTPQDPLLRSLSLVTPWLIGLGLLVIVLVNFRRWRSQKTTISTSQVESGDDAYRNRLEADLKARR